MLQSFFLLFFFAKRTKETISRSVLSSRHKNYNKELVSNLIRSIISVWRGTVRLRSGVSVVDLLSHFFFFLFSCECERTDRIRTFSKKKKKKINTEGFHFSDHVCSIRTHASFLFFFFFVVSQRNCLTRLVQRRSIANK